MFKHYGSITVLAVAGVGFSGLSWAISGGSVSLQQALGESSQAPFLFPVEGVTAHAGFASTHEFLIDTTAFIETPAGVHLTLAGAIANADGSRAGLTKTGGGTLALGGANTYGGNTRVTAGTLRLEGASAAGSSLRSVELFSGTTLEYAPGTQVNNMLQLWHPQDDAGQGAQVVRVTGAAPGSGEQEAGLWVRLSVPEGRATQAGSIAAAPGAQVNLVKEGQGSLVLSGFTHAPVAARVSEGALAVQAFFGGAVSVENSATLAGTGTVGRIHVLQGGTLSPGLDALAARPAAGASGAASPATLSVAGNLVLDDGSNLHLNVWPDGRGDKVQVLGIARLGGTLQARAADGNWAPDTRYTVVQAQGGLEGTAFDAATTNLAYLTPGLEYDASAAYLTLTRNDRPLDDVLDDPGDDSVGDVIDDAVTDPVLPPVDVVDATPSDPGVDVPVVDDPVTEDVAVVTPTAPEPSPDPAPVSPVEPPAVSDPEPATPETVIYDTIVTLAEPQAADALRELDGSWQASVQSRLLADTRYLRDASLQEWRRMPATLAAGARTWAGTYGARATRNAQGDTHGDNRDLGGLALGATWSSAAFANGGRLNLGVVAGAEHSRMQRQGAPADASVRSLLAGFGAGFTWNDARLVLGAISGWHKQNVSRLAWLGNLPQWLSDARRATSQQVFGEMRLRLRNTPQWNAQAFGRFTWARVRVAAGSESGGLMALDFDESAQHVRLTELGLAAERHWNTARGRLSVSGEAAWQNASGNLVPENRARFRDSPAAHARHFTSRGQPLPRHALNLRLGAQWAITPTASLSLHYTGQLAQHQRDHSARLLIAWHL